MNWLRWRLNRAALTAVYHFRGLRGGKLYGYFYRQAFRYWLRSPEGQRQMRDLNGAPVGGPYSRWQR